jgi:hypothetical protein
MKRWGRTAAAARPRRGGAAAAGGAVKDLDRDGRRGEEALGPCPLGCLARAACVCA